MAKEAVRITTGALRIVEIPLNTDLQYFQREDGQIYRFDGDKLIELKGWIEQSKFYNWKFYRRFSFKINGKNKKFYHQRITCFTFHGDPGMYQIARHKTKDTLNCAAWAVEWGDFNQNNYEDKLRDGTLNGRKKKDTIGTTLNKEPKKEEEDIPF